MFPIVAKVLHVGELLSNGEWKLPEPRRCGVCSAF